MTLRPPAVSAQAPGSLAAKVPTIRIVAPASNARPERLTAGAAALTGLGYSVSFGEHAEGRYPPYFAARPEDRLADLHAAFADPSVDIVMCSRGGYGSNYLLEQLDLDLIGTHPKPLFGYSDLTAVQTWLMDRTGLVAFHGPMLAADFYREDGVDHASFLAALCGDLLHCDRSHGLRMLRPGQAEGTLYGGCLTMLTASLGTPFAPQTEGKLLFLEDVGVKPYQVDRMLRQLRLAGKLEGVPGILFGEMLDCVSPGQRPGLLEEAILGALDSGLPGGFAGPVGIGLRSGHVSRANVTLPFHVRAELSLPRDGEGDPALRTLEPAVLV